MRTAVLLFAVCVLVGCASTAWCLPGSAPGVLDGVNVEEDFLTHSVLVHVNFTAAPGYVVMQDHWWPYDWSDIVRFTQSGLGGTDIELVCHLSPYWDDLVAEVQAIPNKTFIPEGTNGLSVYWPDGVGNGPCYSFQSESDEYVPEPTSLMALGMGLLAIVTCRRRSA